MMTRRFCAIAASALAATLASGCATLDDTDAETTSTTTATPEYREVANPDFAAIRETKDKTDRDRLAILAMRGEHRVDFHFMETVRLGPDYERHDDKTTGAFEVVYVVENTAKQIVLQHVLVMPGGGVIKHWRQDWTFEAPTRFEFVENQTWAVTDLPVEKTRGAWTQCVYEVSDAPRYCGTGKWNHRYGVSTWTSDRTWRPLPRRDYTKRDDYNAINAENRHTVTAHGWTHEQDNTKTVRDGRETMTTLVREFGFNDYRRIEGYDFAPGAEYWAKTGDYWQDVRAAWSRRLQPGDTLYIDTAVDGMPIITGTFGQAAEAEDWSQAKRQEEIETLLNTYTRNATDTALANANAATR
ncbi:MAG: DUF6607 family protein [Pseudomonadota bacterium]